VRSVSRNRYVQFTVPADWIKKVDPHGINHQIRAILDDECGIAYGRCDWQEDQRIVATSEQFGKVVARLMDEVGNVDLKLLRGEPINAIVYITEEVRKDNE
jgi:hypothetical protein